jgi:cysteinyl-tRNA synthetase
MAETFLGPVFEIHGGGLDLVFPHHENELAQSRGAGRDFARIWMHNGMLEMGGADMHKSLGNDVTLHSALQVWGPEVLLLFFLGAHWRSPIDFSDIALESARTQAAKFRDAFAAARQAGAPDPDPRREEQEWQRLVAILDDNFNTPEALALLHRWRSEGLLGPLRRALEIFGLGSLTRPQDAPDEIVALAERRLAARKQGNWSESDRLRREINAAGWEIRDTADGYQLFPGG